MKTLKKILSFIVYFMFLRIISMILPSYELQLVSQQFYDRYIKNN
jgi:hypothetical protein